jgi:hypothetical protein
MGVYGAASVRGGTKHVIPDVPGVHSHSFSEVESVSSGSAKISLWVGGVRGGCKWMHNGAQKAHTPQKRASNGACFVVMHMTDSVHCRGGPRGAAFVWLMVGCGARRARRACMKGGLHKWVVQ